MHGGYGRDRPQLPAKCKCGYQICLFCYRHIKEDLNGLCPACPPRTRLERLVRDARSSRVSDGWSLCTFPLARARCSLPCLSLVTASCRSAVTTAHPHHACALLLAGWRGWRARGTKELKDKKEMRPKAKEKREAEFRVGRRHSARGGSGGGGRRRGVCCQRGALVRRRHGRQGDAACASGAAAGAGAGAGCNGGPSSAPVASAAAAASRLLLSGSCVTWRRCGRAAHSCVMGLSPRIAKEDLRRHEYFGQYGKIAHPGEPAAAGATSGPPSLRCCITYASRESGRRCLPSKPCWMGGRSRRRWDAQAQPRAAELGRQRAGRRSRRCSGVDDKADEARRPRKRAPRGTR